MSESAISRWLWNLIKDMGCGFSTIRRYVHMIASWFEIDDGWVHKYFIHQYVISIYPYRYINWPFIQKVQKYSQYIFINRACHCWCVHNSFPFISRWSDTWFQSLVFLVCATLSKRRETVFTLCSFILWLWCRINNQCQSFVSCFRNYSMCSVICATEVYLLS